MDQRLHRDGTLVLLLIWFGFLAGWTAGSVPLTLAGAPFAALWVALITGLAGAWLAFRMRQGLADCLLQGPVPDERTPWPSRGRLALASAITLSVLAGTAFFIPTGDARPLWVVWTVAAAAVLWISRRGAARPPETERHPAPAFWAVGLLALVLWAGYILILRHDSDDAFYLNLPMGMIAAPHGMLEWDTMYGAGNWPVLGSNYRVEAMQTLIAALAWASGLPVALVAHLVLPTIWCVIWAATLGVLGTALFGRSWWVFAVLAALSSLVFAGTLQNWGVHGISRLFHGKAPLMLVVVPLIYLVVHRFERAEVPPATSMSVLAGLILVALGLTANAIYIAPLALGVAVFAAWAARGFSDAHRLAVVLSAAPALVAGLWLLFFDRPVSVPPDLDRGFDHLGLWEMSPDKLLLGLLALTFAAGLSAALVRPSARFLTGCFLGAALFVINPFLWPYYDRFVTGGLNFRLWWGLPVPLLFAILLSWGVLQLRPRVWPLPLAAAGLVLLSLMPFGLLGMAGTEIRPSFTKYPAGAEKISRDIIARAGDDTVLAAESVSAWLATVPMHPPQVYVRQIYLGHATTVVDEDELASRQVLADWINGEAGPAPKDVAAALGRQCPRLLVFPTETPPEDFEALAREAKAGAAETLGAYQVVPVAPPGCR